MYFLFQKNPISEGRSLYLSYSSVRKYGKVPRLPCIKNNNLFHHWLTVINPIYFVRKWRWKHPGVYLVILRKWIITSWWSSIYNSDLQKLADRFIQHFHLPIPRYIYIHQWGRIIPNDRAASCLFVQSS